jgi:hypothetical protein
MKLEKSFGASRAPSEPVVVECCWVGLPGEELPATQLLPLESGEQVHFTPLRAASFGPWLERLSGASLAAVIFSTPDAAVSPDALRELRKRLEHRTCRVFLAAPDDRALPPDGTGALDFEDVVTRESLQATRGLVQLLDRRLRGVRAPGNAPLAPPRHLDRATSRCAT